MTTQGELVLVPGWEARCQCCGQRLAECCDSVYGLCCACAEGECARCGELWPGEPPARPLRTVNVRDGLL